jgi:DNA-binding transcriptional LysR family regulator
LNVVDEKLDFVFTPLMQIESLKVFCDLADTESFTKTAQINDVTQSAVSQQLSSLGRIFKSVLIERRKKNSRLTREGQVLYDYSKQIIQTYDSLHSKLQELKDIISGTIRVATIYSIGLHDLPPYLTKFMKVYPMVNVHVEYRHARQVYEDVLGNHGGHRFGCLPGARCQTRNSPLPQGSTGAHLPPATFVCQAQDDQAQGACRPQFYKLRARHPHPQSGGQGIAESGSGGTQRDGV